MKQTRLWFHALKLDRVKVLAFAVWYKCVVQTVIALLQYYSIPFYWNQRDIWSEGPPFVFEFGPSRVWEYAMEGPQMVGGALTSLEAAESWRSVHW